VVQTPSFLLWARERERERERENSDYKFFPGIKQHQVLKIMAIAIKRE
jgi:hypothetical protein